MELIPAPKAYHRLFQPLEPGNAIVRSQLVYFFALLGVSTLLTKNCAPVQSCKILFLSVTLHFFLNFFYAFEVKTELEVFRKRHYSLLLGICIGVGLVYGEASPGFFFVVLNIPFLATLLSRFHSPLDRKWKVLMLGLNVATILFFVCCSPAKGVEVATQHLPNLALHRETIPNQVPSLPSTKQPRFFYLNWSLSLVISAAVCAYVCISHYDRPQENVFHLGNLVNFVLICFLPFLFVLQKSELPPMQTWLGYILLLPTVVCLSFTLGLGYFFLANMKPFQLYSLINLLTVYFIFISCNLLESLYGQAGIFCVLLIFALNFPLKDFTVIIKSYYAMEAIEGDLQHDGKSDRKEFHTFSYTRMGEIAVFIFIWVWWSHSFARIYISTIACTYLLVYW